MGVGADKLAMRAQSKSREFGVFHFVAAVVVCLSGFVEKLKICCPPPRRLRLLISRPTLRSKTPDQSLLIKRLDCLGPDWRILREGGSSFEERGRLTLPFEFTNHVGPPLA